jgi:hypothetical protein
MEPKQYNVVFKGEILPGHTLAEVKNALSARFKLNAAKTDNLFTGRAVTVKGGVDYQTAVKLQAAFQQVGAVCYLEPLPEVTDARPSEQEMRPRTSGIPVFPKPDSLLQEKEEEEASFVAEAHEEIRTPHVIDFYLLGSLVCALLMLPFLDAIQRSFAIVRFMADNAFVFGLSLGKSPNLLAAFWLMLIACFLAYIWLPFFRRLVKFSSLRMVGVLVFAGCAMFVIKWLSEFELKRYGGLVNISVYTSALYFSEVIIALCLLSCLAHFVTFALKRVLLTLFSDKVIYDILRLLPVGLLVGFLGTGGYIASLWGINIWYNAHPPSNTEIETMLSHTRKAEQTIQTAKLVEQRCTVAQEDGRKIARVQLAQTAPEFRRFPGQSKHLVTFQHTGTCESGKQFEVQADYLLVRNPPDAVPRDQTGRWGMIPIWKDEAKYLRITLSGPEKMTITCVDVTAFEALCKAGDMDAARFASQCQETCIKLVGCDLRTYLKSGWKILAKTSEAQQNIPMGNLTCPCYIGSYTLEKR